MFANLRGLTNIGSASTAINTSNVTNMSYMFYYTNSISEISISTRNLTNVTNTNYMFYNCTALQKIVSMQNFAPS